ncbi:ribokinase [Streptococcus dysgalactiae]|uniref:Ribokinase n=3 Tax=Streptococcus dysgalactiae TaxID=1334 RepID=A0A380JW52_STRDY|nr:ribokinase [Streptococcus dysgalactiae]EFY03178.1 ribokinase [Streptococcus dysgalactiae subsp. dysgalactiae ATCC 27957]MCB2830431.1 ribokinase [Streptococcus dysgalactiae subsp. dysgalactiae]MCB2834232.1 ribokinase [Streptococcus dysgalactiae subsp. dysgalactiae]MCB2835746.1 ribokinase [Streptococcus dysgalactiae subsp. dysgalactiae]MCB2839175.1 ribokinase [Streptococcus dysgalactiae subsp. dysgalactiae]
MSKIVIVGSISMDLVMKTNRIAQEGETVFGDSFAMVPGGKGANQAVAVGRLASQKDQINMLGAVGEDSFGPLLLQNLADNSLNVDFVGTVPSSSGIAQITIFNHDNRIIYCPGANGEVDTTLWEKEWDVLEAADLVILQNEIPHQANLAIAQFCHDKGIKVLYNPAPARETDKEMLDLVTYFTPNQHEVQELFPDKELDTILEAYPNRLIVTLGTKGSTYFDGQVIQLIPAIKTEAIDTTGAGDTFNGAFGFAVSKGLDMRESLTFATLASHLSVQQFGAQGGMPTLSEMKEHDAYEKAWDFE